LAELDYLFLYCRAGNAVTSWIAVRSSPFLSVLYFDITFFGQNP
jgi:hypothetical protein